MSGGNPGDYVEYHDNLVRLMKGLGEQLPGPMSGFSKLHREATSEGALGTKEKELIALGIAISARCDVCVAFHVHDSLRVGVSREEISEALGVAVLMGGGPAAIYGCQTLSAPTQFEEAAGQAAGSEQPR